MSLAPRAVLVHRRTLFADALARHGTRGQVEFFLRTRGRDIADLEAADERQRAAFAEVAAAVPLDWRSGSVERGDLSRFLFAPEDVVVVVGQDGLVANV
ncbi:MAG: sugar kinase, partial [Janthinobacterium lividum]